MTMPVPMPDPAPRLTLVTIPDCHLCDRARGTIAGLATAAGVSWREEDLTTTGTADPMWWEQVPLVLVDGRVVCFWRVDEAAVRAALGGEQDR